MVGIFRLLTVSFEPSAFAESLKLLTLTFALGCSRVNLLIAMFFTAILKGKLIFSSGSAAASSCDSAVFGNVKFIDLALKLSIQIPSHCHQNKSIFNCCALKSSPLLVKRTLKASL